MNNYFIAIKLPSEILTTVFPVGAQIHEFSKASIISYENLHITLKFLGGALTTKQINEVKQDLQFIKGKPFLVQMTGVMAFPSTNFARVIGISAETSQSLLNLRKQIDSLLPPLPQSDNRELIPHLTLARVNSIFDKTKLKKFFERYKQTDFGRFEITEFYFIMSKVSKAGTKYEIISNYNLGT